MVSLGIDDYLMILGWQDGDGLSSEYAKIMISFYEIIMIER